MADNKRVFLVLKACTLDGSAWRFIQQFNRTSNGRAAILALKLQNKGGLALTNQKEEAYHLLHNTQYKGERHNFGFVKYTDIHTGAHAKLEECNKPLAETRKVTLFLAGIQDPKLQNGKDIIIGNKKKKNSFQSTQAYLGLLVINRQTLAKAKRQVAATKTNTKPTGAKRFSKKQNILFVSKKYSKNVWWNVFNQDERKYVMSLWPPNNKQKVDKVPTGENQEKAPSEQGRQFGRAAHKKEKRETQRRSDLLRPSWPT